MSEETDWKIDPRNYDMNEPKETPRGPVEEPRAFPERYYRRGIRERNRAPTYTGKRHWPNHYYRKPSYLKKAPVYHKDPVVNSIIRDSHKWLKKNKQKKAKNMNRDTESKILKWLKMKAESEKKQKNKKKKKKKKTKPKLKK